MVNHPTLLTMLAESRHTADLAVSAHRQRSLAPDWLRASQKQMIVSVHNIRRALRPALHER